MQRHKPENPSSDARFHRTPFGLSFANEGFGFSVRLAMFAAHEAPQAFAVVGDKARSSFLRRSGEFAGARVGSAHFVGRKTFRPHRRVTIVGMQSQPPV